MSPDPTDPVRRFWQVWSGEDHDLLDIIAPEATENGEPLDPAEFQEGIRSWRDLFEAFAASIDEVIVCDDRVVTRVTYSGTHVKQWGPLPASGASFTATGIDIFRVMNGRITELWHAVDHLPLVRTLGGRIVLRSPE
jgi:predicted ester cyclase